MIKRVKQINKILILMMLTLILVMSGVTTAFAATEVLFTTNGAKENYIPGSALMVYGKVENKGIGVPNTSTFVEASIGGNTIFYGPVLTDQNGYFKTGFNIPGNNNLIGQTLTITVNNSQTENFLIKSREQVESDNETEPFEFLGFTAPGYLDINNPREILASVGKFGLVFNKNVNYFKNNEAPTDLKDMGANEKNEDCFVLYEAGKKIKFSVDLLDQGGDDVVIFTNLQGKLGKMEEKKTIFIKPNNGLKEDTQYKLIIKKDLVSNSSVPLKNDITIYFKTAKASTPGDIPGGVIPGGTAGVGGAAGGGGGSIEIPTGVIVEKKLEANGTITVVPKELKDVDYFIAKNDDISLTWNAKALEAVVGNTAEGDMNIALKKVDASKLSDKAKEVVGDRPVFDIKVMKGNQGITDFKTGKITIKIPYTLKEGEKASNIIAYYINDKGVPTRVSGSRYDATSKAVVFVTNHLSTYGVGYTSVSFSDVSGWSEEYIYYLADRNIIQGKSEGIFAPKDTIKRSEFAAIVARMSGADLTKYKNAGFSDVKNSDWFMPAVSWCNEQGIAKGSEGKFHPNANITRQEMAVMLKRYAETGKISLPIKSDKITFSDEKDIATFAKESVSAMQQAGIIAGKGSNQFAPRDNATREEAAKMISVLLQN